jgi:N-acetylneuraminic acid mutarotase
MPPPSRRRRVLNLAVVAAVGLVVGVGGYLAFRVGTAPAVRPAPGWQLLAEMPHPRGETASAVLDGKVYVAGGYTGLSFETTALVSIYDVAANRWSEGPLLPAPRNHAAAASLDGVLYVSGGTAPDGQAADNLWALDPDGAWTELPPMPGRRSAHRMVALDGRLFVVGGVGGLLAGPGMAGLVLVFDPATASWSALAQMAPILDHLGAVAVGDRIWTVGGRVNGRSYPFVKILDPTTANWESATELPEATSGAAEATIDGVIYLSGGEDPATGTIVDRHWRLDTSAGRLAPWEPLPPPPLAVHGVQGIAVDGRFLVIGGSTRPGGDSATAWTGATQAFAVR